MPRMGAFTFCIYIASLTQVMGESVDQVCGPILSSGIHDTSNVLSTSSTLVRLKAAICSETLATFGQAQSASGSLGVDVVGIVDGSLGGKSSSESYGQRREAFCALDQRALDTDNALTVNVRSANVALAQVFESCVRNYGGLVAFVTPSADLKRFTVEVKKRDGSVSISAFKTSPEVASCSDSLDKASTEKPISFAGSAQFVCERKDATENMLVVGATVADGALFKQPIELPGTATVIEDLLSRLNAVESSVTPKGQLAFFELRSCPLGWSDIPRNWEGRYFVTTVADATPGAPVGNALSEGENRATGEQVHDTSISFFGGTSPSNGAAWGGARSINRAPGITTSTIPSQGSGTTIGAGTNAPYVSLRGCMKN
jgi:hypothetical protein